MFDSSTSLRTENFSIAPIVKTKNDSFFVYALKGKHLGYGSWSKEYQEKIDEENEYNLEKKNAVSLNDLLGSHPHIKGKTVEVLQLLLLNQYGTEAMVEVRYL